MTQSKESANLDLLRAIAVSAVFFDHLLSTFGIKDFLSIDLWAIGRLGVLIFFVHTSLVLLMSMERLKLSGAQLFSSFYIRRAFRIYPLSIAFIVAAIVLHIPSAPWRPVYQWLGTGHVLSNLALTQNLTFSDSVLGPLWSLPYEVQMYVLLPVLFLLVKKWDSLAGMIGLWFVSVAAGLIQPHVSGRLDLAKFVPCFLGGVIAYQLLRRKSLRAPFWLWPVTIFAVMASFVWLDTGQRGWVACLLLGIAAPQFREMRSPWLRAGSHALAKYSYGIYLSHIVVMWFSFVKLAAEPLAVQWCIFVVLSAALPFLAYHLLESPMIRFGAVLARRTGRLQALPEQAAAVTAAEA